MFEVLRQTGVVRLVADSKWRRQRLLILCYHGIAQEDEHLWRPALYMEHGVLESRLEIIRRGNYNVLPLGEALRRLRAGELPPRSVSITFDDGMANFAKRAFPLLQSYGFPVTVYQTTYYTEFQKPIFNLICSYLLWKRRSEVFEGANELGLVPPLDLRTETSRNAIASNLVRTAEKDDLSGAQKDELAAKLAALLGIDYQQILGKRLLHVMSPQEIAQLARQGVDFQLHTHRHRALLNEELFREEIQENRSKLQAMTGTPAVHFCYPSGVYKKEFAGWLKKEDVVSATTCEPDLATVRTEPLRLPRFIDTSAQCCRV